jgi:hypothetical protein
VLEYAPTRLVAWGTKTCRAKDGSAAHAVNQLIAAYQPTATVLPSWRADEYLDGSALDAFIDAVSDVIIANGVDVLMCSPEEVYERYFLVGAQTKYEIAERLADEFPELRAILPRPRQNAETERAAMTVFDALALATASRAERR